MKTAEEIKKLAKDFGADLVGIASMKSLEHLPDKNNPKSIFPDAKSVIVVGHRILRGALRGVEEGTNFHSTYQLYGFFWAEDQFLSRTAYDLACALENDGICALPLSGYKNSNEEFSPVYEEYAKAAGLGDVGKGGFFLTPEYGHRQRFALIITNADLPGDKPCKINLCEGCRACADACPLGALKVKAENENFQLDISVCKQCQNGAIPWCVGRSDAVDRYAASCGRACMVALENKIGSRFENKFRKRSVWSIGPDVAMTASLEEKSL